MLQLWAVLLLLSAHFFHPALELGVSCLWEEFYHIGHKLSGVCQIHQPAPSGCQGQSLRLATDGLLLLPYHHTLDIANFTVPVPATPGTKRHLRCELGCPGPEPIAACDITIHGGYPPPSPPAPRCHVPCGGVGLHCAWGPGGDPLIPEDYTLHWEPAVAGSRFPGGIQVSTTKAIIPRVEIQVQSYMSVWVIARNPLGSSQSEKSSFNPSAVQKPCPPVITEAVAGPTDLEILWSFKCPSAVLTDSSDISCQVQHRRQGQDTWTEGEDVAQDRFLLVGIQAFSLYMLRVRCACPENDQLTSDWTDTYTAQTAEAAPVGVLDVWSDWREKDQAVVWKELPVSQARGRVLGYLVEVEHAGGSRTVRNVSAAELGARRGGSSGTGPCCRLPLTLRGVTRVGVSAYTSQGRTRLAPLAVPVTGDPVPRLLFVSVAMGRRGFIVSWDPPSHLAETIQEYVLQQEEAGLKFTQGFDWTRANKTQRISILTGDFRNYTPYNLSLFGVFDERSCLLGSVIAYTKQWVPAAVPDFQASRISSSDATLTWQHIPLTQRKGVIQYYLLGQGDHSEYVVSGERTSLKVSNLQPGQMYHFWIAAKNKAGEGPKTTLKFSTHSHTGTFSNLTAVRAEQSSLHCGHIYWLLPPMFLFAIGLIVMLQLYRHRRAVKSMFPPWCSEKVPGLTNSKLLLQFQIKERWLGKDDRKDNPNAAFDSPKTPVWTKLGPAVEPDPILCVLEVVEALPGKGELAGGEEEEELKEREGSGSEEPADRSMEESRTCRATYNEETQHFSDYEKHYMPSPLEVSERPAMI